MNLYNSAKAETYTRNTILTSLEGKQLSVTKSRIWRKNRERLTSSPTAVSKRHFTCWACLSSSTVLHPALVWLYNAGKVVPLPCPLPPSWSPWQHLRSFLAKSFSKNPSLSLASALGQERRQKDILRMPVECQQLFAAVPQPLPCSHRIPLSLSEHPSATQRYRYRTARALWEIRHL